MNKILTIDQGTTSSRSIIFDQNGDIQDLAQQEYPLIYPNDGWVEIEPHVLMNSVEQTLNNINLDEIAGIGITNQRETTLVWDRETGEPIYNAIVWQDRRTAEYCSSINDEAIKDTINKKTGLLLDPYFSATKIRWILDKIPNAQTRAEAGELCFGTVDTYLMYKLSKGEIFKTDITNASRTMLFDIHKLQWDDELLSFFNIPKAILPEVIHSDGDFGTLNQLNDLPVKAVLGDQQAALFGQGCLSKGDLKSTYGTGCFLMANIGQDPISSKEGLLTTIGFSLNGKISYAIEGSIYAAGTTVQWLRDNLEFFSDSSVSENFLNEEANANGVHFIPAFTGLGAPYWNSEIRASFHGITRNSSKADLISAAFNSISYQTKDIIDCLSKAGINVSSLNIDGGMVSNITFAKQIANLLNLKISIPENKESTARGVAILAGIKSGIMDTNHVLKQMKTSYDPELDKHKAMQEDYILWKSIIESSLSP